MGERGSGAAGGGLPPEEREDRAADLACADASRAGAGSGLDGPGGMSGVRGCGACRRRPGPSGSQGGTSPLGIDHHPEDYGRMDQGPQGWRRRTWLAGASTRRVMIRRDRQWARTRMRPYTTQSKYAVCRGIRSSSNGSIRRGATVVAHHVPIQFSHNRVLASCACVFGLSCINQPTSIYCFSRRSSVRQESIIGPLHQPAIDRPEFNLNQVILARDAKRSFAKTTE